jgi:hypothetical protein
VSQSDYPAQNHVPAKSIKLSLAEGFHEKSAISPKTVGFIKTTSG